MNRYIIIDRYITMGTGLLGTAALYHLTSMSLQTEVLIIDEIKEPNKDLKDILSSFSRPFYPIPYIKYELKGKDRNKYVKGKYVFNMNSKYR